MNRAYLVAGDFHLTLPVNVYTANWGYQENTVSMDTIGGRVVQLLSVQVTDLTIETVAGSRRELQRMADGISTIMKYHIKTSRPASFKVPSRKWNFQVYVSAMPQMGWDYTATTYPYSLTMAVQDDLTGIKTKQINVQALNRLSKGIGYNPSVHGGDPQGFSKIVKTVTSPGAAAVGPLGGRRQGPGLYHGQDSSGAGTGEHWKGKNVWSSDVANAPWTGGTIKEQIQNCFAAVFNSHDAEVMACIAGRESSYQPDVWNSYGSPIHYVYGLFQISDVHSASPWWPTSGVHVHEGGLMYDPEYNTRCAMQMFKAERFTPWVSTSGTCGV